MSNEAPIIDFTREAFVFCNCENDAASCRCGVAPSPVSDCGSPHFLSDMVTDLVAPGAPRKLVFSDEEKAELYTLPAYITAKETGEFADEELDAMLVEAAPATLLSSRFADCRKRSAADADLIDLTEEPAEKKPKVINSCRHSDKNKFLFARTCQHCMKRADDALQAYRLGFDDEFATPAEENLDKWAQEWLDLSWERQKIDNNLAMFGNYFTKHLN